MVSVNRLFTSVFLAILYASYGDATAVPSGPAKYTAHYVRDLGNGIKVPIFHPPSNYSTFEEGLDVPLSFSATGIEDNTVSFVSSQLKMDSAKVSFKSGYTRDNGETFGYAKQVHNGIPFVNAVANVAYNKDNKVVAFGQSFVDTANIADSNPSVDVNTAIPEAESTLNGKKNDIQPTLQYLALQDGSIVLAHVFQVKNDTARTWYEAYVDAHSGKLLSFTDFASEASYRVLPIWKQDPTEGLEFLAGPNLPSASPNGWHTADATAGNNVIAFKDSVANTTTQSSSGLIFDYTYNANVDPTQGANVDASRTNAFYLINAYHDTLYQYGLNEGAFNFQMDNLGKGGLGGDPVQIAVRDPNRGITQPSRDGVFQNDIPIHEMTHGLTNRMTGGGTATCLQMLEAGGLDEGWADTVAEWFVRSDTSTITDFAPGTWVVDDPRGIRSKPYSTSITTNPANILHNVYAELVREHGFSTTARTNAAGTQGNVVFLHLLVDALALQPCNPTFPQARDAWLQADKNRYGGANHCLLWRVFASRGLGVGAALHIDSLVVPVDCVL
ncbi:hypothetical protein L218DRAFT_971817 [Marasmius fiardii PR-910]|nr:hypothetical protein L218DRAFT_971817 [Marasmius fiardii PR-910]